MINQDDQPSPYFWLPENIKTALLERCGQRGISCDELFDERLERLTTDPQYRDRISGFGVTDAGWPDAPDDCLMVAALRALRYRREAEAFLLEADPDELAELEAEAVRRGLEYDELMAEVAVARCREINGEVGPV